MRYDAVVIGAGPAGSSTAHHLAARGYQVLLLDKRHFPREKPCGDGLTPRALAALQRMGLTRLCDEVLRVEAIRIVEHRHGLEQRLAFEPRDGAPTFGGVLRRYDLDQSMCGAAVAAGAELWTGVTALRVELDGHGLPEIVCATRGAKPLHVSSRFAIIAEGSAGGLAEQGACTRKDRQSVGFAVRQYFEGRSDVGPFFEVHVPLTVGDCPIPGYGWLFPVADHVVNVGVGITYGRGSPIDRVSVRRAYMEFLAQLARVGRMGTMKPCSKLIGAPLRAGLIPEETIRPGLLLVGDAAGLVSPFTGEGIAQALESGELAAEAVHDALVHGHTEARTYPLRLTRRFRLNANLRGDLPTLYGLARLYDWLPSEAAPHTDGTILVCLQHILMDHDRPRPTSLRTLLWKDALQDPSLSHAAKVVEDRLLEELSHVSYLFGELAYYTREGAFLLPGYAATVILSAAACAGQLDEETLRIAVASELLMQAALFHIEVGGASEEEPDGWKGINVAGVLMGDAAIARLLHVLNQCDVRVARAVSDAIVRQSEHWVLRTLSSGNGGGRDAAHTTTAIAEEIATIVGVAVGRDRAPTALQLALELWAGHLMGAVQILHDLWMDYQGPGLADAAPLFLARRGQFGHHAVAAIRRGVDVRAQIKRFHEDARDPSALEETKRAIVDSEAVRSAIDEAHRQASAAESMLDAVADGWDTRSLRVLARNVKTALACATA